MIVYFTGTGNSKYVAEMLADLLDDSAVSAVPYLQNNYRATLESEKPWIFVSPVYVSAMPTVFQDFIRRTNLAGNNDAYFVMTCAGGMGASPVYCQELCRTKGLTYRGTSQVVMPQNYLVFFKTKEKAECDAIIDAAGSVVRMLADRVRSGISFLDPGVGSADKVSTKMILAPYYKYFIKDKEFHATNTCISCGKCARVCPLNNIHMVNGKPVWSGNCTHCMACINYCPKEAIEYGKKSLGKPRYHCPAYKKEN